MPGVRCFVICEEQGMRTNKNQVLYFVCLMCCAIYFSVDAHSQTRRATNLRRDEAVVRRDRPTVYICLDRKTERDVWLRIYNNTIWTTRFHGGGRDVKMFKLPDGTRVAALSNGATVSPEYRFESKQTGDEVDYSWGDVHSVIFLPSDTYALFKVPDSKFGSNLLFLEYTYEWEFTGAVGSESHAPQHRIYFSGNSCDW